jgi:hypothetical protein
MLQWNTVSPLLKDSLFTLMKCDGLSDHRLVGGTALSLYLGHRMSIDIDLFTDQPYGSIDYSVIEMYLQTNFPFVRKSSHGLIGMGSSYIVGDSEENNVKLDIYYTDEFIMPAHLEDGIRLATIQEIAAMKIDIVHRGGRKKDFWDIHEMLGSISLQEMINFHKQRHPYTHNEAEILVRMIDFSEADHDYDPTCLKGKYWELIKYEISEEVVMLHKKTS